ncbi:hypothetical protein [Acutalibacter muris]|jgi:hypothetical protein|uniref:hypothetical protein n=1 Tax=Acutalibacter muris TaxID=1796620 RepID=UPI00272DD9AF|nr:hypothetical protein [Acutalibacter muris]
MEKREYTLEFNSGDEERFLVIAYMGHYRGFPKERGRHLPIEMAVKAFEDHKEIDFARLAYSFSVNDGLPDPKFVQDCKDILHGRNSDWILGEFEVFMTGVNLKYYHEKEDREGEVYLHAQSDRVVKNLHMEFRVPHVNGKSDTLYWLNAECRPGAKDNCILLAKRAYDTQSSMMFGLYDESDYPESEIIRPDYADVTEYIDV